MAFVSAPKPAAKAPAKPKNPVPDSDEFLVKLTQRLNDYIRRSDMEEEARRRSDRLGVNMYYGRHWNVPMPKGRAALTVNISKSLIKHKIAIMTKQMPMPVVQPEDQGDVEAARLMRTVLQNYWREDRMMVKSRLALLQCNITRTVASKTYWDPDVKGGIGGITTDIIPGYRLLLDPNTRDVNRMEFAGDRAWMPRTRAMQLYPHASKQIAKAGLPTREVLTNGGDSPMASPWKRVGVATSDSGGAIVNGRPVITAFTGRAPSAGTVDDGVELIEMYYRDRSTVEKEVVVRDQLGNPQKQMKMDASGVPIFEQVGEWDDILGEPGFKLVYEDVTEIKHVRKYPYYRRSTMLFPDQKIIDDAAYDAPLPYELLSDEISVEGPWDKGVIHECEDLQSVLNISLSTMLDNLRFSAFRAFKKTSQSNISKSSLVINPGDVIDVGQSQDGLMALEFPQLSEAWFAWIERVVALMERIVGATGVMQGESAGRVDSAQGYDMLAEIGGSRIVECTQRFEEWIGRINHKVGWFAQRFYTEEHAVSIEDHEGNLTWQRAAAAQLQGTFAYHIATGSTLAWNESSIRARVMEEYKEGLRDKISVWQKLNIEDWQSIKKRSSMPENQQTNPPPPPRTRQSVSTKGGRRAPKPHG